LPQASPVGIGVGEHADTRHFGEGETIFAESAAISPENPHSPRFAIDHGGHSRQLGQICGNHREYRDCAYKREKLELKR
jgi:hypothetical protein